MLETKLSAIFLQKGKTTILAAILCHNLNDESIDVSESKMPSSTSDRVINQFTPYCPKLHNLSPTAKNTNFLLVSVSRKGSTPWAASQLLASIRMALFWSSGHTPICCKYAMPPFPRVKCLHIRTPDMCIRRALFTLINGPRLWQGVSCARPDSSDK